MNKVISFKHITGGIKPIPGIDDADCSPRLVSRFITHPAAGSKQFPVMMPVEGHIVHIVLVNEDYVELSEADQKLPQAVRDKLEQERAEDMLFRRAANESTREILRHYAKSNDIEIISESELDPQGVLDTQHPILKLSDVALSDHEARGIKIPSNLQNGSVDTERIRAAADVAKQKALDKAEKAKKNDD